LENGSLLLGNRSLKPAKLINLLSDFAFLKGSSDSDVVEMFWFVYIINCYLNN